MSRGEITKRVKTINRLMAEGRHEEALTELKQLRYKIQYQDRIRSALIVLGMCVATGLVIAFRYLIVGGLQ